MISVQEAIRLLRKYSNDENSYQKVLNHVKAVQKVALRIASKIPGIDIEKLKIACLLHDIGRFKATGKDSIRHGILGGEILRNENLEEFARFAECHIGVGITKEDIIKQKLNLPEKDFIPKTREEKILAHADNLIFGDREGSLQEVIERYKKELGEAYVDRIKKLKKDIDEMFI